ncbi:MAG TPA: TonB-dependent receptor [Candidatus Elarobacter sp.]|jgi:outer membrane receptor protein involved in Fe transport|nr:TonB-dependent receptor [Candidatus Elarobacter sp.]
MSTFRTVLAALAGTGILVFSTVAPARADVVGIVRGTLTRADHRPLSGVTVTLTGDRLTQTAVTGADGRFAFPRVPFGHYTVRATAAEGTAVASVDVATDAIVDVALEATPVIGRTGATTTSVRGTPVSENAYGARRLAALPRNDRLDAIVEQVPGVVRFSYDEPVAHGFHGLSYELDGAPLPQSTSSNFAQLIDPRNAQAVEIFTGAFPAEFGGSRQGAIVNVVSGGTEQAGNGGALTLGAGELGSSDVRLVQHLTAGRAQISLALNGQRTNRALDTPSKDALHDASSSADQFLRITLPLGERDLLAADFSNQYASFQIPINTSFSASSPFVAVPGTDDVQREYDRFASLSFTHTSKDANGYVRVVPWVRWNRVAYDGDLANDLLATVTDDQGNVTPQNGLRQDRVVSYAGLRASAFRASDRHALKIGLDLQQSNLRSSSLIRIDGSPDFTDDVAAKGTQTGAYAEDKWTPTRTLAINAGLRYDHSTGFTGGSQLSPRFEINDEIARGTVLHAYFGRLYAAPSLEDVRRDAVVTETASTLAPVYDLQPERDTYVEVGLARTFRPGLRGYVNAFDRTAVNVLDTTQLANTPLFAVFNNAIGRDRGVEARLDATSARVDSGVSLTYQRAEAGGVSGGTFLFPPDAAGDLTLQPEDHDQSWSGNAFYTRHFGDGLRSFATLQIEYGTGFPTQFENGEGRLPAHWIVDASLGRAADRATKRFGYTLSLENLFDNRYLIKVNNGFNTTQWNAPRRVVLRVTAPW